MAMELPNGNIRQNSGRRVIWHETKAEKATRMQELQATSRSDYGAPIDITIPNGYHAQVERCWEMYESDRFFRYLVERVIHYSVNGHEWELPLPEDKKSETDIKDMEKQKRVWEHWSKKINKGVPNVLPGLGEVHKWGSKHMMLSGMAPFDWEWGPMKVDGETYQMPVRMVVHNAGTVVIERKNQRFVDEKMFLKVDKGEKKLREGQKAVNKVITNINDVKGDQFVPLSAEQAFALKYQWTPGDFTSLKPGGKNVQVGQGIYPSPPFIALFEVSLQRRSLRAADIALADAIINYILEWDVGDATVIKGKDGDTMPNQPLAEIKDENGVVTQESSLDQAKKIITSDNRGGLMEIIKPYYIKLNIKMPDVQTLLSAEKYIQSMIEMLQGFGILFPPINSRMDLTNMNTQNFEAMLYDLRINHWAKFVTGVLAEQILDKNESLTIEPNYVQNIVNTKTKEFREDMHKLSKIGKISTETLHQAHGLNSKVELPRIKKEVSSGEKEIYDKNVPVSFVQKTEGNAGADQTSKTSASQEGGRPDGAEGEEE